MSAINQRMTNPRFGALNKLNGFRRRDLFAAQARRKGVKRQEVVDEQNKANPGVPCPSEMLKLEDYPQSTDTVKVKSKQGEAIAHMEWMLNAPASIRQNSHSAVIDAKGTNSKEVDKIVSSTFDVNFDHYKSQTDTERLARMVQGTVTKYEQNRVRQQEESIRRQESRASMRPNSAAIMRRSAGQAPKVFQRAQSAGMRRTTCHPSTLTEEQKYNTERAANIRPTEEEPSLICSHMHLEPEGDKAENHFVFNAWSGQIKPQEKKTESESDEEPEVIVSAWQQQAVIPTQREPPPPPK